MVPLFSNTENSHWFNDESRGDRVWWGKPRRLPASHSTVQLSVVKNVFLSFLNLRKMLSAQKPTGRQAKTIACWLALENELFAWSDDVLKRPLSPTK